MFVPLLKSKEMNYFHRVLLKNNYPDWIIKNPEEKATPNVNPNAGLQANKNIFISVPYDNGLSEELRRIF